jgi:hypothetical protein
VLKYIVPFVALVGGLQDVKMLCVPLAEPGGPVGPCNPYPVGPRGPVDPCAPVGPVDPREPVDPRGPVDPSESLSLSMQIMPYELCEPDVPCGAGGKCAGGSGKCAGGSGKCAGGVFGLLGAGGVFGLVDSDESLSSFFTLCNPNPIVNKKLFESVIFCD